MKKAIFIAVAALVFGAAVALVSCQKETDNTITPAATTYEMSAQNGQHTVSTTAAEARSVGCECESGGCYGVEHLTVVVVEKSAGLKFDLSVTRMCSLYEPVTCADPLPYINKNTLLPLPILYNTGALPPDPIRYRLRGSFKPASQGQYAKIKVTAPGINGVIYTLTPSSTDVLIYPTHPDCW